MHGTLGPSGCSIQPPHPQPEKKIERKRKKKKKEKKTEQKRSEMSEEQTEISKNGMEIIAKLLEMPKIVMKSRKLL